MTSTAAALRPPQPAGMGRGALLALAVHVGLVIALAFGVSWRSSAPAGMSAELWAAVPQVAAPAAAAPPEPVAAKVEPKPQARPEPPPSREAEREAEIALEKAKAEKARREEQEREKQEREKFEKAKAEREKVEREKLEREKALKAAREEKAEAERIAKLREDQLKRIQGQAGVSGATGAPGAAGSAQRDAGPSAGYAGRIVARVKPNIVLTESVPATLRAEVEVRAAPDGTIVGRRLVKSSGNRDWDDAVLRAIDRTEVLPRDVDGRVPPTIVIGFTPS